MLWKRHLSVYSHSSPKKYPEAHKQAPKQNQQKNVVHSTISPETIEAPSAKFLIRKKSRSIKPSKQVMPKTFFLHKGNNSQLVKGVFESFGFVEVLNKELASFIWYQSQEIVKKDIGRKELLSIPSNYFLNHAEITNKQKLYENLFRHDPKCVGNFIPKTYVIDFREGIYKVENILTQFLIDYFKKNRLWKLPKKSHCFSFANFYGEISISFTKVMRLVNEQKIKSINYELFETMEPMWIIKPTSLNRGKGIQVFTQLKQLQKIFNEDNYQISIRMYQPEEKNTLASYVIQEYILNPLLYEGYKFDLRMWLMIKKTKKDVEAYIYNDGYARLAAYKYGNQKGKKQKDQTREKNGKFDENLSKSIEIYRNKSPQIKRKAKAKQENDKYIHLTNNAVQKNCKDYGILHEGNQVSLTQLLANLKIKQLSHQYLMKEFIKIIQVLIQSTKDKLFTRYCNNNFQLFGLDFLIDNNLKVWLIQVNCNPSLEQTSTFLKVMLRQMIGQLLQLVKLKKNHDEVKDTEQKNEELKEQVSIKASNKWIKL